jgi:hypothetical protein
MNQDSQWRTDIAKQAAQGYSENPNVAAVILGGSTSRGHADRFSDIEIGVFWHNPPSKQDRQEAIERTKGELIYLYDYDPDECVWCDDFMMGRNHAGEPRTGILIEVCHYMADFMEQTIHKVVSDYATDELLHNLIAGVVDAVPLYGINLISKWQLHAAAYPRELAIAIVKRYGVIDHFWRWKMYLNRGENLPLIYKSFSEVHLSVFRLLLGLNRVYYFGFKWIEVVDQRLQIKPDNFLYRIRQAYITPPNEAAQQIIELVDDTYGLIETQLPETDVKRLREIFHYARPIWDHSPLDDENNPV